MVVNLGWRRYAALEARNRELAEALDRVVFLERVKLGLDRFVPETVRRAIEGKGRIAEGADADLVLVDRARRQTITNAWIRSRCGWTPFDGREVTGWPLATVLRGRVVMRDGERIGPPSGQPLRFLDGDRFI